VSKTRTAKERKGRARGRAIDRTATAELTALLAADLPLRRDLMIEYLHRIQDTYGALHAKNIVALADLMKLAPTEVYEVATFYHHFDVVEDQHDTPPTITVRGHTTDNYRTGV